jgi:hypothetical protein
MKTKETQPIDGLSYVIVRTQNAGVFAGYLISPEASDVTLVAARRIWYWKGAASLSQMANDGVKYPNECKFPAPVLRVHLFGVIEILQVTDKAKKIIEKVPPWTA